MPQSTFRPVQQSSTFRPVDKKKEKEEEDIPWYKKPIEQEADILAEEDKPEWAKKNWISKLKDYATPETVALSAFGVPSIGAGITRALTNAPKAINKALRYGGAAASGVGSAPGIQQVVEGKTLDEKAGGALNLVLGGLGAYGSLKQGIKPKVVPEQKQLESGTTFTSHPSGEVIDMRKSSTRKNVWEPVDTRNYTIDEASPNNRGIKEVFKDQGPSNKLVRREPKPLEEITSFKDDIKLPEDDIVLENIQFAKADDGGVKIGADVGSLGKVLGSSLYSGNIRKIATKELMQNSIDAVRELGENGKVDITFNDSDNPFVEVSDNGKGLTKQELETVFTDLGASGKRDDANAIGGFGLAKAAPLLGGKAVEVTTVVREADGKLYKHTFRGTPEELLAGVKIHTEPLTFDTPTGTIVKTYVPASTNDSYQSFYQAQGFAKKVAKSSPSFRGKITISDDSGYGVNKEEYHPVISHPEDKIIPLSNKAADIDIIIPKDNTYTSSQGVAFDILNNGMYQTESITGFEEYPNIPERVLVNIKSKVPEGHPDYPFTANRENLRGDVRALIDKYIKENIINPSITDRHNELSGAYTGLPEVKINAKGPRKFFVYDVKQKFTPEELQEVLEHPASQKLAVDISDVLHDVVAGESQAWQDKLEKVGFLFDDETRGVHIPNPGQNKSAILINPFAIFSNRTPDQAAAGLLHVILHETAHISGFGDTHESYTPTLANVYEKYGLKAIPAQQRFLATISDGSGNYTPEIQELLSKYLTSRGREGTKNDALFGTGTRLPASRKGQERVPGGNNSDGTGAITQLREAVRNNITLANEQRDSYRTERGERVKAAGKVRTKGMKGFYQQLGKLKGEYERVEPEPINMGQEQIDALRDIINANPKMSFFEKIRATEGLAKITGQHEDGNIPQPKELELLKKAFGDEVGADIQQLYGGLGMVADKETMTNVLNIPRQMKSSLDYSAPFRQAILFSGKKEFYRALGTMFRGSVSEKTFQANNEAIRNDPLYKHAIVGKLGLTELDGKLSKREEAFQSNLVEKIPYFGQLVRGSNRAYTSFLNKLRFDVFKDLVKQHKEASGKVSVEDLKNIAEYVNNFTGRGTMGENLSKAAPILNGLLFSPKLMKSRINVLNPYTYVKMNSIVRKDALKSLLKTTGMVGTALMLAELNGLDVGDDPTSTDFLKIRVGDNTRVDMMGGFQQYLVLGARLLSGKSTSSVTNRTSQLNTGKYGGKTSTDVVGDFLSNKEAPVAAFAHHLFNQQNAQGGPINPKEEVKQLFIPMVIDDLHKLAREDPKLLPLIGPAMFGVGVQTYTNPIPRRRSPFSLPSQ